MSPRRPPEPEVDAAPDDVVEPTAVGRNVAPMPANAGEPVDDLDEPLPRGDDIRGGVRFVTVTHPGTGGSQDVPEHLVAHWASQGWERADGTPLTTETVIEELGELVDDEPTTGAPSGNETTPESQED